MMPLWFLFVLCSDDGGRNFLNVAESIDYVLTAEHIELGVAGCDHVEEKCQWAQNGLAAWATLEDLKILLDHPNPAVRAHGYLTLLGRVLDPDALDILARGFRDNAMVIFSRPGTSHDYDEITISELLLKNLSYKEEQFVDLLRAANRYRGPNVTDEAWQPAVFADILHDTIRSKIETGEVHLAKLLAKFQNPRDVELFKTIFDVSRSDALSAVLEFPHPNLFASLQKAWDGAWEPPEEWPEKEFVRFSECLVRYQRAETLQILLEIFDFLNRQGKIETMFKVYWQTIGGGLEYFKPVLFDVWEEYDVCIPEVFLFLVGQDPARSLGAIKSTMHLVQSNSMRIPTPLFSHVLGLMVETLFVLDPDHALAIIDETLQYAPTECVLPLIDMTPSQYLEELSPTIFVRLHSLFEQALDDPSHLDGGEAFGEALNSIVSALCEEAFVPLRDFVAECIRRGLLPEEIVAHQQAFLEEFETEFFQRMKTECRGGASANPTE